jgi:hypothetical protein
MSPDDFSHPLLALSSFRAQRHLLKSLNNSQLIGLISLLVILYILYSQLIGLIVNISLIQP